MKITLIAGIILLFGGIALAAVEARPLTGLSNRGEKVVSYSIVIGFLLIGISSIMYLRKN